MKLTLEFVRQTSLARLYRNTEGGQQWVPRSVCDRTLKWPGVDGKPAMHEVEISDWWAEKNPWPPIAQPNLKLSS